MLTQIHGGGIVNLNQQRRCEMTDIRELRRCIEEHGMSITFVAEKTGILRETLYNRMKTGDFKISEISALSQLLNLSRDERDTIFFAMNSE